MADMDGKIDRIMQEGDESKLTPYERDMRKIARDKADGAVQEAEKSATLNAQQRAVVWNREYKRIEAERFIQETSFDNSGE